MISFFAILFSVFLLDLGSKTLVRAKIAFGSEIPVLPVFSLVHVNNTGIAFGLFQGRNLFFIAVGLVVTALLVFYSLKLLSEDRFSALVMAMVLGGAFGNLVDRLRFGKVTDFLDFYVGVHHWPAFNVADSSICVGAALLLWHSFRRRA